MVLHNGNIKKSFINATEQIRVSGLMELINRVIKLIL